MTTNNKQAAMLNNEAKQIVSEIEIILQSNRNLQNEITANNERLTSLYTRLNQYTKQTESLLKIKCMPTTKSQILKAAKELQSRPFRVADILSNLEEKGFASNTNKEKVKDSIRKFLSDRNNFSKVKHGLYRYVGEGARSGRRIIITADDIVNPTDA